MLGVLVSAGAAICLSPCGSALSEWNLGQAINAVTGPRLWLEGRSEGDPRKIADVIVQLANSDEGPVRLILGVDAEQRVQQAEGARAKEAKKWRHFTVATVFEDGRFDSQLYRAK